MFAKINYLLVLLIGVNASAMPLLTPQQLDTFAQRLWQREASKSIAKLTSWNEGEAFPSLGIGHFIWYPAKTTGPYKETFPELLLFLKKRNSILPAWLEKARLSGCPWKTRAAFLDAQNTNQMNELRLLLAGTVTLQAEFVIERFLKTREALLAAASVEHRDHVAKQFDRLAATAQGLFALIDYVHFKGEGTQPTERYSDKGWGLLQVLQAMNDQSTDVLQEFIAQAKKILEQRVALSPAEKGEKRWMPGWLNRVIGYAQF